MQFILPQEVKDIIAIFEKNGYEAYVVGGAVRDLLMGKAVIDWDFTTNAKPEEIISLFDEAFYNNKFGTVGVKAKNADFKPHEITTFRKEFGYSDRRRPDKVEWGNSLEEDLMRRDFTVNAMALKVKGKKDYEIIDPHMGQKDLDKKLIRAVGDPVERFNEDALRMMRAVRFAAELNFKIEKKTLEAMKTHAPSINAVAKERIGAEFMKIMASPHPHEGILLFRKSALMREVLPELEGSFEVDQVSVARHHIYDVGTHLVMSLKAAGSADPVVRLAVLMHDIGKPETYKKRDEIITFYNHEVVGARMAKRIAQRLRLPKKDIDRLWILVRHHQFTVDENQSDSSLRRFIRKVGIENVEDMLELRRADRIGSGARETSWRTEEFKKRLIEVQKQPFSVRDLKITGNDVMRELGISPGPKVGEVLGRLFDEVEAKNLPNEQEALLARLKELK